MCGDASYQTVDCVIISLMFTRSTFLIALLTFILTTAACTQNSSNANTANSNQAVAETSPSPPPVPTPNKALTAADVAKLKWMAGTWRGVNGDKPFFERYRLEGTTMIVEGLDETGSKVESTSRFELKDGEFGTGEGDSRAAASEITDTLVKFVPGAGSKGNIYQFVRQDDGTWLAILDWPPTEGKPPRQKVYKMEPWPKK